MKGYRSRVRPSEKLTVVAVERTLVDPQPPSTNDGFRLESKLSELVATGSANYGVLRLRSIA